MKKLYSICACLLVAVSAVAQISFWGNARIGKMYNYDEVDSITIKVHRKNQANILYLWKSDNIVWAQGYIAGTGTDVSSSYFPVDSIVWHPYPLLDATLPEKIVVPMQDIYGRDITEFYCGPTLNPSYADFTYSVSNSNPEVATVESNKSKVYGIDWLLDLIIKPIKLGKTTVSVTFNDAFTRTMEVEIGPREEMQDEIDLSLDSLFNKIYSRLVLTGDVLPAGRSDLRGVDEGISGFFRGLFNLQDMCADQLYWVWNDPGIFDLERNNIDANNPLVHPFFRRLYYNIWMCNSYLHRSEGQSSLAAKRAEVRFLRAYFYYYLLDMFANVPIITDNTQFFYTPQSTRAQLYQFVESELLAAETDMLTPAEKTDYYRVDKAAAWLLLSRLYLNSAVYAGVDENTNAAKYAYKVIQSSYDLASHYQWLFMGDNDKRSTVNDAWKEIILPVRQEGASTASYCGSLVPIAAMSHYDMPSVGIDNNWYCIVSRAQLPKLFFSNPATAAKGTAEVMTAAAGDDRALFCNSYNGTEWSYNKITGNGGLDDFYKGWAIQKWTNLPVDENYEISSNMWPETDIPLMRKAEAYLNYAEALLRGGAKVENLSALDAVNTVRQRANAAPLSSVSLDNVLDERGREFYSEGYRRSDLIRFGKFGGNTTYNWEWKNNVHNGSNFPDYMNLYPIPAALLELMYQGVQNEGY